MSGAQRSVEESWDSDNRWGKRGGGATDRRVAARGKVILCSKRFQEVLLTRSKVNGYLNPIPERVWIQRFKQLPCHQELLSDNSGLRSKNRKFVG